MATELVKGLSINLKNLTIKAKVASSNLRDWKDRLVYNDSEFKFDSIEELEGKLLAVAESVLEGSVKIAPSSPFAKRVEWLVQNGHTEGNVVKDSKEAREVLTGEKKVKPVRYAIIVKSENHPSQRNLVLKETKKGIRFNSVSSPKIKMTKTGIVEEGKSKKLASFLTMAQKDSILEYYGDFLAENNAEIVEVA